MVTTIELPASGMIVRLSTHEMDWCRVELQAGHRVEQLGADDRAIVVERLSKGLQDSLTGPIAGEIDGIPIRFILTLSEKHCTIYAGDVADTRRLFIQGPGTTLLATVSLSREERHQWLGILAGEP